MLVAGIAVPILTMGSFCLALLLVAGVCVCEGAVRYGVKSYPLQQGQCPSPQERERVRAQIRAEVEAILSGTAVCDGSSGWRRVGLVNMTDPSQDCPPGLNITSHPIRTCGSSHETLSSCSSTTFSVGGMEYSQVCGRIKAYQYGYTYAYLFELNLLEDSYVDGVSLTHGAAGERQHIWTFAAGLVEEDQISGVFFPIRGLCPCDTDDPTVNSPPFVGGDYFCETGTITTYPGGTFFGSDPLWDGEGCGSTSTCCQFNNPPWFTKTLPAPTTDDIELRLCHRNSVDLTDIPIELIELYIK